MKKFITLLFGIVIYPFFLSGQDNLTLLEEIFVHTDKTIYSPGENIWFKAYILDDEYYTPSNISDILYLHLISPDGKNAISEKFPISKGTSYGDLQLPDTLKKGEYQLVAYTETMKSYLPSFWFRSKIVVNNNPKELWKINYYPDLISLSKNTIAGEILCKSSADFPISNAKIKLDIKSESESVYSKSYNTDSSGRVKLSWNIPEINQDKEISLNIEAIYLGKTKKLKINVPTGKKGVNIQFFPESGNLVESLENNVAFKATDNFGNPLKLTGVLINQDRIVLKNINTFYNGMGVFSFTPNKYDSYYVKLNNPHISDSLFILPKAKSSGYILSLKETHKNIVSLSINMTKDLKGTKIKLNASNGLHHENLFKSELNNEKHFSFITSALPIGIYNLTLFSEEIPVAERLVFINKYKKLNLFIESEKDIYDPREKVELTIKAIDFEGNPASANLSLSVSEKNKIIKNEPNISSSLLLGSKLKGITGDLSYYLKESAHADSALNLLLMTHGWRKVEKIEEYTRLIKDSKKTPGIRGTVQTKKGKPAKNAQVQILDTQTWNIISTEANNYGDFFIPLDDYIKLAKSKSLSISAVIPNNQKELIITIEPDINSEILSKLNADSNIELIYNLDKKKITKENKTNYTDFDKTSEFIEEVTVTGKKSDPIIEKAKEKVFMEYSLKENEIQLIRNGGMQTDPDLGILSLVRLTGPPFEIIQGKVIYRGRSSIISEYQVGALFVVNGVPYGDSYGNLDWVNPYHIKDLKITTSPGAALKYGSTAKGLIEITLLEGDEKVLIKTNVKTDENLSVIKGFKINKEFYSPNYSVEKDTIDKKFDSRSTIYWNPLINIDSSGIQKVTFYNGDKRIFFQCNVAGVNSNGLIGSSKMTLRVD